jgi:hypothetical protein
LIDSASLVVSKCVNALNGTGVDTLVVDPPCADAAVAELVVEAGRDVPFNDVVALDEVPVPVLVFPSTVEFELAVAVGESAEVWVLFNAVVLTLPPENADVDAAGCVLVVLVAAVKSAFPELAAAPDPAPDDEPAVLDAMAVGAVLIDED